MEYYILIVSVYIQKLLYIIFKLPFFKFYIKGPKILGCWESRQYEDICSSLTGNPAEFWKLNNAECSDIINNKFESYYILFTTICYTLVIYKIIQIFWWRYFVYKPMINDIVSIVNLQNLQNLQNKCLK